MKQKFIIILSLFLCTELIVPIPLAMAAVSPQISEFLCDKGIFYYNQKNYDLALKEFKKALLANPESSVAYEYILLLEKEQGVSSYNSIGYFNQKVTAVRSKLDEIETLSDIRDKGSVNELISSVSNQKRISQEKNNKPQSQKAYQLTEQSVKPFLPPEVVLDIHEIKDGREIEVAEVSMGERLVLKGKNIARFLVVQPEIAKANKTSSGDILFEPLGVGETYMHIWDDSGRKTFKITVKPMAYEEMLNQEYIRMGREVEELESFKLSYSMDGNTFLSGRGVADQKRQGYGWNYSSSLIGETPYGNFDAAAKGTRSSDAKVTISNLRVGLTNGHFDQFKDINIRFVDFTPTFNSFGFPSSDLRGSMIDASMFNKKLNYTTFWGAIPEGNFSALDTQVGLTKTKKAWLEGLGFSYKPLNFANITGFYAHSYGPERTQPVLTDGVSGVGASLGFGVFNIGGDVAYDMLQAINYTGRMGFNLGKLRAGLSMTDISKNFASVFGGLPNSGSTSGNFTIDYTLSPEIRISNTFTGYLDKVFGNPERPTRPNYLSVTRLYYKRDRQTEYELAYTMDDQIGSNSPSVVEKKEFTVRKKLFFFKTLNTYLTYMNAKSKNYKAPASDYLNNSLTIGFNFEVIRSLSFYHNRTFNYLTNPYLDDTAFPLSSETGLNYDRQIFDSPFYINSRIFYRDEEQTESVLSYLSGEDRLEGECELKFKPDPSTEAFFKGRISNVWAEKTGTTKHMDFDLNWGLRFVWDTGIKWKTTGAFDGYVFYDKNGDGVYQRDELGVEGVQIRGPENNFVKTDSRGYFRFPKVVGKKAGFEVNVSTLPRGYNLTTSSTREVSVVQGRTKRLYFGIATRTEISGYVFIDDNRNGQYDFGEKILSDVVINIDNKTNSVSGPNGAYVFRKIEPGEHKLILDLKSIPVKYIPKVPVAKTVKIVEGAVFVYNIPLEETKAK